MKIQPVIDRALKDPVFAAELAAKAGRASRDSATRSAADGLAGDAWEDLLRHFADSPEELARLTAPVAESDARGITTTFTTTTTTTITTTTSLPCGITTTTTTTTGTTGTTTAGVIRKE